MRRVTVMLALLGLGGCVESSVGEPRIVMATPGSVEISCIDDKGRMCRGPQAVADAAKAYCAKYELDAEPAITPRAPAENDRALFNCVKRDRR